MPGTSVHQIVQSKDGYLWLATEAGVARFDGFSFRVLRHESEPVFLSDDVSAIAQDAKGTLWFGTADGLIQSRGSALHRFAEEDGLPSSAIVSLAALRDGSLLILTSAGAVHYDGSAFHPVHAAGGAILSLEAAQEGDAWLFTGGGPEIYRGDTEAPVSNRGGASISSRGLDSIQGIQFGPGHVRWTWSARALRIERPGLTRVLTIGQDLPGTRLTALCVDGQGAGWIGTNRGLFSLQPDTDGKVQSVDALRLENILSILEDREGNVWVGTESSGLHVLRPRKFRGEPLAAGEAVTAGIRASDNSTWFGTRDDGVRRIADGISEQPVPAASLTSPVVLSMAAGQHGDVWVGTPDGLNHIVGHRVVHVTSSDGLPDDFVRSVLVDSHGTTWAGTRQGLARIEGRKVTTLTQRDGLGSDSIGPLLEATARSDRSALPLSTDLWVGTSAGLSHLQGTHIESFSPDTSRAGTAVTAVVQTNAETLWVGLHEGGLHRFASGRFSRVQNSSLPREITDLFADRLGFLWLRGERGVYRVAIASVQACADDAARCGFPVRRFGTAEGMPSDATTAEGLPNAWEGSHGELDYATRKGVAIVDPVHLPYDSVPPPVVLQHFLVDDVEVPVDTRNVEVGTGHRRYVFEYVALSYTSPSSNRYRYTLEGLDRGWLDAGTTRTVSYSSLPPRQYRFRVQAQNGDGVWSDSGAEVQFYVLSPIYRRWWFLCLLLLAGAGLVMSMFRLRLRSVQAKFDLVAQERNRVAREIHDTLAQDFVSVSLQVEMASHLLKSGQVAQATAQLEATRKAVKAGLDEARQSIWNLRTNTEKSLPTRLTVLCNQSAEATHRPRLSIGGTFRKLPTEMEDGVFRIAQEAIVNSSRHAEASEVLVRLSYTPEVLRLSVCDNGRGFVLDEARQQEGHYGLRGMQERAAALGATLAVTSSPGEGAEISLILPLAGKGNRRP